MEEDEIVLELALQCGMLIRAIEAEIPDDDVTYCIGERSVTFHGENLGRLIAALVGCRGALTNFEEPCK